MRSRPNSIEKNFNVNSLHLGRKSLGLYKLTNKINRPGAKNTHRGKTIDQAIRPIK